MKKLAACAALCGVLIGCDGCIKPPAKFSKGDHVLVHDRMAGTVYYSVSFKCHTEYWVLLDAGQKTRFEEQHIIHHP